MTKLHQTLRHAMLAGGKRQRKSTPAGKLVSQLKTFDLKRHSGEAMAVCRKGVERF